MMMTLVRCFMGFGRLYSNWQLHPRVERSCAPTPPLLPPLPRRHRKIRAFFCIREDGRLGPPDLNRTPEIGVQATLVALSFQAPAWPIFLGDGRPCAPCGLRFLRIHWRGKE
ncbi:uncharacterized protein BT62DRAFT_185681 [Guyanagaster necrorhizus]|uniref:Uncharacterized protein n=1 Tax=Guyanagaster necrorhizus TaxID=856835 RepID=A0A9P7VPZ0_9AGAR|nr:uncharacterized protein BT62DRAFT_185681 [Guyanagaster necrorhizus MCA 3950]KAG7445258.1 hypothetical protein BT62DRAFT_185681 [Guyanagaster necrorhizus MCA 3950]